MVNVSYLNDLRQFRDELLDLESSTWLKLIAKCYSYSNELIKIFEKDPTSAQFYAELLYHYREEVKDAVTLPDQIKELINKPITSGDIKNINNRNGSQK